MEPVARDTGTGKSFTCLHPDNKASTLTAAMEDLTPINIEPTERGVYGYPLEYQLDFEPCFECFIHFQTLQMLPECLP